MLISKEAKVVTCWLSNDVNASSPNPSNRLLSDKVLSSSANCISSFSLGVNKLAPAIAKEPVPGSSLRSEKVVKPSLPVLFM